MPPCSPIRTTHLKPASVVEALVSGSAKTGDYLLVIAGVAAAVAAAAAAVAVVSHRKKGKHAKR